VGAWSFCQDKIMTTGGEGGMVTTHDETLWRAMWAFKDHGKSHAAVYEREHPPGFRWLRESFGTNWRMLEMQAVIGRLQLRRLPDWTARREAHARTLRRALEPWAQAEGPVHLPMPPASSQHAHYKFYFQLKADRLAPGWNRDRVVAAISQQGVPCYQGSCSEVYLEKAFDGTGWRPAERLPVARELGETSVMLLVHPTLEAAHMARAGEVLQQVLTQATQAIPVTSR
jgi:dTDP-4-amino-4,6-dideoxygalactose transaminase